MITAFCDGACSGNPGPGGWAFRIKGLPEGIVDRSGNGGMRTTNNRMELSAAIAVLEHMAALPGPLTIRTDSRYVIDGITSWIVGWKRKGWQTSAGKAVLNEELWRRLDALNSARRPKVDWMWVKGHAGHDDNEAVDRMAVEAGKGNVVNGAAASSGVAPSPAEAEPAVVVAPVPEWLSARLASFRETLASHAGERADGLIEAFDAILTPP